MSGDNIKERYNSVLQAAAQKSKPGPKPNPYIAPASIEDALFDQLEYLVAHAACPMCPPNCLSCERLKHVTHWLMLPFQGKPDSE